MESSEKDRMSAEKLYQKLQEAYRNKLKMPYYYVPACPKCGSYITGRFVRARNDNDADWIIDESLRHGEIVSPVPKVLSENCFCCECNTTFTGSVEMKWLSMNELDAEKLKRDIYAIWQERQGNDEKKDKRSLFSKIADHLR